MTLTIGDRKRLQPFVYLNDSIIDFRLRHFMRTTLPVEVSSRTHVFSCQFFTRLSQEKDPFEAYKLVSSWTKQIDLLSLDFIVVPINDGAHWSLTIIVRPFLALKNLVCCQSR